MKTILVTGGAGFIGSNFVHYMLNKYKDYRILILDALTYSGSVENLPKEFCYNKSGRGEFWYGNITNADLVGTLVGQSDVVVHFAAESHVTRSIFDNTIFFQTDVIGTQTIASAVYKHRDKIDRFIHISTSEVYGTAVSPFMSEEHPLNPASPYAAAKAGADRLVYSYWNTYHIPSVIVRPFNNYGPRQHLEKVVPRFITSVLLNEPLRVHGDGMAARDFVHVLDTCSAIDKLIHASADLVVGEAFNIGTGIDRTVKSIADDVIREMGSGSYGSIGDRPGQVFRHTADNAKIKRVLDWSPSILWEDGLRDTINWYKENKAFWEKQLWLRDIAIISDEGKKEIH